MIGEFAMLYTKDKEALFNRYSDCLEDLQEEPLGDPAEYRSILGRHVWGALDDTYRIFYDERSTVEAVLVREDGVFYVVTDGHNAFIDPAEEVQLTREEAITCRNQLIDAMTWSDFYNSIRHNLKDCPKECGAFLDKIRPLYKEMVSQMDPE